MNKCKLCNKTYSYNKYNSFGRSCLAKMYKITDIEIRKDVKDKETYLISKIARRLKQKARAIYEKLIDLSRDNPDVVDVLRFLREREVVYF